MSQNLVTSLFPEWAADIPPWARLANRVLRRLKLRLRIEQVVDGHVDMTTLEQRLCLAQLLTDVVQDGVAGDIVECGSFEGKTAALLTRVAHAIDSARTVHLYDSFRMAYFLEGKTGVEEQLRANFAAARARLPEIHKGLFDETIPAQLPARICFAHIDVGTGGDHELHKRTELHCLRHLYERLSPGAVCVLMDCNDGTFLHPEDGLLAVREAAGEFLSDKPEKLIALHGGQGAMAYFRRSSAARNP